jgi:hsp70-interacting protein
VNGALDSDIGVRRKTAFLLNTLLFSPATTTTSPAGTTPAIRGGGTEDNAGPGTVHPNSHAALVADPRSADTSPATLSALSALGLLPVIVRELVAPTPYGPDGDEGGACDADFEEKLARCVRTLVRDD